MHRLTAAVAALLVLSLAAPAAAEPVEGFGFGGVVEVPAPHFLLALDDGGFVLAGEVLTGIGPDGRERWSVDRTDWDHTAVSDGRVVYVLTPLSVLAIDGSTGEPVTEFGGDGEVDLDQTGALMAHPRGGVLVNGNPTRYYGADGSLVDRFAFSGVLGIADDGSIVTVAADTARRYTPSGDLDRSWGDDGALEIGVGGAVVAPDGALVAVRQRLNATGTGNEINLVRWTPEGVLDASFGLGGVADAKTRCAWETVSAIDVADDGSIYLLGASSEPLESVPPFVAAFDADGTRRGHETIGSGSPYVIIGRDGTLPMRFAVRGSGERVGVVRAGADGLARLHAFDVARSFDDPEGDAGYWLVSSQGPYGRGTAPQCAPLSSDRRIVGAAPGAKPYGYWMVAAAGRVEAAGQVPHLGEVTTRLNAPVLGVTARPQGDGYWLLGRDGGVFSFGGASFFGSTGAMRLNQPIVGMASTPSGRGYWLVASDGGIFSFGDARFFGSTGAMRLNQPIVGMASTPSGRGYWLVASDGGIFSFGDAPYLGTGYDSFFGPHEGFVGIITP